MRNWQKTSKGTSEIGILLFDRFSNHCLANTLEPLRAANALLGREVYKWTILSPGDATVTSSSGLPVTPVGKLADRPAGDALFVISSYGFRGMATDAGGRSLRALAAGYDTLVGLDTGSWLLASAGLLNGHRATIHPDILDSFAEQFPETQAVRARYLEDGNRWSSSGAMAAFELIQHMIGQTHGTAVTVEIGSLFLQQTATYPTVGTEMRRDRVVERALAEMRETTEAPLSIPNLAARAGCSQRQLSTRFSRALGASPQQVYRRVRLNAAWRMIDSEEMPIAEVADRCGYVSAASFSRAFREEFGATPGSLR